MSRKKGKKRRFTGRSTACFVFTVETITLTQKAIALFEQPLQRANHLEEKIVFAEEMTQHIKQKLRLMKESVGHLCLTTFDYNEKIIIRQSMLLYTLELLDTPPTPQRNRVLHQCRTIATYFTDEIIPR